MTFGMMILRHLVAYSEMRYATVGDWDFPTAEVLVTTSAKLGDPRYERLIHIHEQLEAEICEELGIPGKDVTTFDMAYELSRALGQVRAACGCPHFDEPGDDPHAPYHVAHQAATACERIVAEALGVDWNAYEETIEAISDGRESVSSKGLPATAGKS